MQRIIEQKIINQTNQALLINVLADATSLSKQVLKSALDKGCVWLKTGKKINRVRRVKKPLKAGDEIFIYFNEKILSSTPAKPELLLDKKDYSIWLKPAGVFAQGSKWGDHCALTRLVEKSLDRQTFLVHRLDRATSGIMMVAHTKRAARGLSELFAQRKINKTYLAIVEGDFIHKILTINDKVDNKHAISHVTLLRAVPIIGDRLYGNADKNYPEDLQLQAIHLKFNCPISNNKIDIELLDTQKISL